MADMNLPNSGAKSEPIPDGQEAEIAGSLTGMISLEAETFIKANGGIRLGEGPLVLKDRLYFVDIEARKVLAYSLDGNKVAEYGTPGMVGAVVPTRSGRLLVAHQEGIEFLDPATGKFEFLCHPEAERRAAGIDLRYNDGKAGPDGRLYIGSMLADVPRISERPGLGRLWVVNPDGTFQQLAAGLDIPNGMDWEIDSENPSRALMYHIESPARELRAYDLDLASGRVSNPRVLMTFEEVYPDGMVRAANGTLLIAMFNGYGLYIVDPVKGEVIGKVRADTPQTTSVALDGSRVYITSAAEGYGPEQHAQFPNAGNVFTADLSQAGLSGGPVYRFDA